MLELVCGTDGICGMDARGEFVGFVGLVELVPPSFTSFMGLCFFACLFGGIL
jgi:hypothetical protein